MQDWLKSLQAEANQEPAVARVPFYAKNIKIGSVEPVFMRHLELQINKNGCQQLLKEEQSGWHLMLGQSNVTTCLNKLADLLRHAGWAGAWRNEQLAVRGESGTQVGTIERAAVRSLGIATLAVHLVGQKTDGRFWVQQRALNKPNDPGKWDTLMGGMVSSGDTVATALERETWEEAGLRMNDLQKLRYGGRQNNVRPSGDGVAGYMQESIEWFTCTVPDGLTPTNQDGEVLQFALMNEAQLLIALQNGDFTIEAALITAAVLKLV